MRPCNRMGEVYLPYTPLRIKRNALFRLPTKKGEFTAVPPFSTTARFSDTAAAVLIGPVTGADRNSLLDFLLSGGRAKTGLDRPEKFSEIRLGSYLPPMPSIDSLPADEPSSLHVPSAYSSSSQPVGIYKPARIIL